MSATSTEDVIYYPDRPGCVTAYAVLLWLGSASLLLGSLSSFSDPTLGPAAAVCPGLFALGLIAIGFGLWRMQKWGWWLVVIIQSLGVAAALLNLVSGLFLTEGSGGTLILYGVVAGAVSGGILYWFINNRHEFAPAYTYQTNIGLDGESVAGRVPTSNKNTTTIIVGVVLAVFLVPVCLIAILTLLGPQVGDVFSRIVNELSAP